MRRRIALVLALPLLAGLSGCGSDGSASDACATLVDAYARAWQRCMRATYDSAKQTFSDALDCGSVHGSNGAQVNQCVSALDSLDCTAVKSGTSPAPCTGALMQ